MTSNMGKRGPRPNPEKMEVLSTRIRAELRKALEDAKAVSGRTLSGEIEYRLRRTFAEDAKATDQFGSPRNRRIMQMLALAMQNAIEDCSPDVDWLRDRWAFSQVTAAMKKTLDSLQVHPEDDPIHPDNPKSVYNMPQERLELLHLHIRLAQARALDTLEEVASADASLPLKATARQHTANLLKGELLQNINSSKHFKAWPPGQLKAAAAMLSAMESRDWKRANKILTQEKAKGIVDVDWWDFAELQLNGQSQRGTT